MPNDTRQIVNKAWSFAPLLRDDGLSYMAYTEQITFLLFLKMAHQRTQPPWNRTPIRADRTRLAEPSRPRRRGAGDALPPRPNRTSEEGRDAGGDLQEGSAGDPESGDAEAPDRGPDRTRGLDVDAGGREGRHL